MAWLERGSPEAWAIRNLRTDRGGDLPGAKCRLLSCPYGSPKGDSSARRGGRGRGFGRVNGGLHASKPAGVPRLLTWQLWAVVFLAGVQWRHL